MGALDSIRFDLAVLLPYTVGVLYLATVAYKTARWAWRRAAFRIRVRNHLRAAQAARQQEDTRP